MGFFSRVKTSLRLPAFLAPQESAAPKGAEEHFVVEVINLRKYFGSKAVLEDVSFKVKQGEAVVLVGASGSGKSVILKIILGFLGESGGSAYLEGKIFSRLGAKKRLRAFQGCGVLFQGSALFDSLTVWENVAFGLDSRRYNRQHRRQKALESLQLVGLGEDILDSLPASLSGGMQKRVALARAVCLSPRIMFYDEPTTGLDPITSASVAQLISQANKHLGGSSLTITHDMGVVRRLADRILMLRDGRIYWQGSVQDLETTDDSYVIAFRDGQATA